MFTFVGHDNWKENLPKILLDPSKVVRYEEENKKEVTIKRNLQFFYDGERTTLERIRAHYTNFAIDKLVHDKFIEIHY